MAMPSAHNSPCSPLWNTWAIQKTSTLGQLSCICIISEEMKFLSQFYTVLALSKDCCVGKWFGRLRQNQLCSLWPHSATSKPWKTSLDVVTATTAETEKNRTAKWYCQSPGQPLPLTSISPCRATAHHLQGSPCSSQLHPLSCGGSNQPLESSHSLGKPWAGSGLLFSLQELAGNHLRRKKDLFFSQI